MHYEYHASDLAEQGKPLKEDDVILNVVGIIGSRKGSRMDDGTIAKYIYLDLTAKDINEAFGGEVINLEHPDPAEIVERFETMLSFENYVENAFLPKAPVVNCYVDMKEVPSTLLLESGTEIATLSDVTKNGNKEDSYRLEIIIEGEVRVTVEEGTDCVTYDKPSEFPDWLKAAIRNGELYGVHDQDKTVGVSCNNWSELYINDNGSTRYVVVDVEGKSTREVADLLYDALVKLKQPWERDNREDRAKPYYLNDEPEHDNEPER